jgi:hypothetical protein
MGTRPLQLRKYFHGRMYSVVVKRVFQKIELQLLRNSDYAVFCNGNGMLIFSVFVILEGLTHFSFMTAAGVIGIAYCVWAIGQFYENKKASSYLKALAAYILGMITFWVIPILSGTIIDLLNKH